MNNPSIRNNINSINNITEDMTDYDQKIYDELFEENNN
jgi:hypothetical protein